MARLTENATHITNFAGRIRRLAAEPDDPYNGDMFYDTTRDVVKVYSSSASKWYGFKVTTSTSTSSSSSTTTTSTSTS